MDRSGPPSRPTPRSGPPIPSGRPPTGARFRPENIWVVGLSHRTAPVAVRECFAFDDEAAGRVLGTLRDRAGVCEAVLLSTCNRTEVYTVSEDAALDRAALRIAVLKEVAAAKGRPVQDIEPHLYDRTGLDAVRHLFRVAASLDSLVVGEPQILGQVKNAFRVAREAGTLGPVLTRVFEKSFKAGKDVRATTAVGTGEVSVGSVAVDLARKVFGDLGRCSVLLIGAGKMGEAVARALASGGVRRVVVANRTLERALDVAGRYGWTGAPLDDLPGLLTTSDAVIASVASSGYLLGRALLKRVVAARRYRPLFLVDIAVPRVIEPEAGREEGIYLYNIDDFNEIINEHLKRRHKDVQAADAIIAREVAAVERAFRELDVQPVIARLSRWAADLKDQEVARALREIGETDERHARVVQALANSLVQKMLHHPILALRRGAQDGREEVVEAVEELFGLAEGSAGGSNGGPRTPDVAPTKDTGGS